MQTYLYFQPQYFGEFVCDASKCNDNCCKKFWNIDIDKATYEKYSRLQPESLARAIIEHFDYDAANDRYLLKDHPCPFLNEKNLCRIQLEFGEKFLSPTCRTYPRVICYFGNFFGRSLALSCPVAAEMILFNPEPMSFELLTTAEDIFNHKVHVSQMHVDEKLLPHVIDIQVAMISILQERTLTIDQRLIVLGFFLDRLDELSGAFDETALTKLLAAYESKKFLVEQVPLMIQSTNFSAKNFSDVMTTIAAQIPESVIPLAKLAAGCEKLGNFKKIFATEHATFFENFLVNEIFQNRYPWQFAGSITTNFGLFAAKYKIFELMILATAVGGNGGKADIIRAVGHYTNHLNHVEEYQRRIFFSLQDSDAFGLINSLLDGGD